MYWNLSPAQEIIVVICRKAILQPVPQQGTGKVRNTCVHN